MPSQTNPKPQIHFRLFKLLIVLSLGMLAIFLGFSRWTPVRATPDEKAALIAHYPLVAGSRIDSCTICHVSLATIPDLNPYGTDYLNHGRDLASIVAIESLDSDNDGFTNLQEFAALTFPGDPADHPVAGTATFTPTPTVTRTPTPTATHTSTQTPTNTATNTPVSTATHTPTPTATNTPVPPTSTHTPTPTSTSTSLATSTHTPTPTNTPTHTPTPTPPSNLPYKLYLPLNTR